MEPEKAFIYESPDGGQTIYRRPILQYRQRTLIRTPPTRVIGVEPSIETSTFNMETSIFNKDTHPVSVKTTSPVFQSWLL